MACGLLVYWRKPDSETHAKCMQQAASKEGEGRSRAQGSRLKKNSRPRQSPFQVVNANSVAKIRVYSYLLNRFNAESSHLFTGLSISSELRRVSPHRPGHTACEARLLSQLPREVK